jgi:hypothetical protein
MSQTQPPRPCPKCTRFAGFGLGDEGAHDNQPPDGGDQGSAGGSGAPRVSDAVSGFMVGGVLVPWHMQEKVIVDCHVASHREDGHEGPVGPSEAFNASNHSHKAGVADNSCGLILLAARDACYLQGGTREISTDPMFIECSIWPMDAQHGVWAVSSQVFQTSTVLADVLAMRDHDLSPTTPTGSDFLGPLFPEIELCAVSIISSFVTALMGRLTKSCCDRTTSKLTGSSSQDLI